MFPLDTQNLCAIVEHMKTSNPQNTTRGNVCVDCTMLLANGETPDGWGEFETAEWMQRINAKTGMCEVTLGMMASEHADGCDALETGNDCQCEQTDFSTSPCDLCGSPLAGARNAVTFWLPAEDGEDLEEFPPAPEYAYLAGKWAYINGTHCYVKSAQVDDCGDETVTVQKDGRTYTLIASTIYSVSA